MDAIEILVNEHVLIKKFLDNLSIASVKLQTGERPPKEFFEKAVEFARNYADKFHHIKEEYSMFARLSQKKGDDELAGQIDALRYQHERGRSFIKEISNSLDGYSGGNDISATTILENMAAYVSLLSHHIHREDYIFFPMVKKELSENELRSLLELFEKEDQKAGGKSFENGHKKLVREMAKLL
jgi:hemerythrin-like domain-containing protein